MKKTIALILAMLMIFCLAACGDKDNKDPDLTDSTVTDETNETNDIENLDDVTNGEDVDSSNTDDAQDDTENDVEGDVEGTENTEPDGESELDDGPDLGGELALTDTENKLTALFNACPMQFGTMIMPVDLSDVDAVKAYTGLDSVDQIIEAAVCEPMISSQAYSLVLVKVKDATEAESVADAMKTGINPAKWVCVEADDLDVVTVGDYVLLAMMSSEFAEDATAKDVTDAFVGLLDVSDDK